MNATRCRILSLLIVIGLVVPAMQVAGHSCRGDSCPLHLGQADQSCSDTGTDSCCDSEQAGDERAEDYGCCSDGGCDCMCCGAPGVTAVVRSTPHQGTIAPRSAPVAIRRSALDAQDAVGALLRPPQA